jgi:hypothetical protein
MNRKRLSQILPSVIGIGFCLIEGMKLAFQFQATDRKDIASGHVEPIRFAPVISADWDYITTPQMIALAVVMVAVMLLVVGMLTSRFWAKERPEAAVAEPAIAPPSPPAALPGPRTFGRRAH